MCVDLKSRRKNYSVQFFKITQGVHGWIGTFDIVSAAYNCRIFVSASFVSYTELAICLAIEVSSVAYCYSVECRRVVASQVF